MKYLGDVYPPVYQHWPDKQSDEALSKFCLYGLGAHRIERHVGEGGRVEFVVRTNALASLQARRRLEDREKAPEKVLEKAEESTSEKASRERTGESHFLRRTTFLATYRSHFQDSSV